MCSIVVIVCEMGKYYVNDRVNRKRTKNVQRASRARPIQWKRKIKNRKSIKQPMCAFRTWAKRNKWRRKRMGAWDMEKAYIALASFCGALQTSKQTKEQKILYIHKVGLGSGFSDFKHAMHTVAHSKMTKMPQLSGIECFLFELLFAVYFLFVLFHFYRLNLV